ncbi:MAG: NrsF family protein [Polyangiales bacterium]
MNSPSMSGPKGDPRELGGSFPLELPPSHVLDRLRAQMANEPPPIASSPSRRAKWLALPLAALLLLGLDVAVRHNSLLRADAGLLLGVCIPSAVAALLIAIVTTIIATSRGKSGLGERVSVLRWSALLVGPLSVLPMAFLVQEGTDHGAFEQHLDPWGLPCFAISLGIAAVSLLVLVRELRRSVPVAAGWRAAALGSAAGAWAGLALLLHCPSAEPQHLAVGHLLPIMLFPIAGMWVAQRFLRL